MVQLLIQEIRKLGPQAFDIDVASAHDGCGVAIIDERQEQVFEGCVFVMTLVGVFDGAMERLFQAV